MTETSENSVALPAGNALATGDDESNAVAPFTGTYGANLFVVPRSEFADAECPSEFALKIESRGADKSGIRHESARFDLTGGEVYQFRCRVYADTDLQAVRLGIRSEAAGHLWAVDPENRSIDFAVEAGKWTHLSGTLRIPENGDGPAELWILSWEQRACSWFLDEVELRITDAPVASGAQALESWDPANPAERNLVVCRPFTPDSVSDIAPVSFLFVTESDVDPEQIALVTQHYAQVFVENAIANRFEALNAELPPGAVSIDDFIEESKTPSPRVVFLAANDTHAQFMLRIAEHFDACLFVIPDPLQKDESAADRLSENGVAFETILFDAERHDAIERFKPDVMLCGADWTSEFLALQRVARAMNVPCVALQEGPQDWRMTVKGAEMRKYRRADVLFSQGAVTLRYIRPKYFAITGNPKTDTIEEVALPESSKVFVNCNFTYGQYEEHRDRWLRDVVSVCRELDLDYLISQHPRDAADLDDPNVVASSAFTVAEQIRQCSVGVSRFSNLTYELLRFGRTSIYYNPHGELPRTFNEGLPRGFVRASAREELREALAAHQANPAFDFDAALRLMTEHCGPMDAGSIDRICVTLSAIASHARSSSDTLDTLSERAVAEEERPDFSVIVCTHNRAPCLRRCLDSVMNADNGDLRYEVILVDNACTDVTRGLSYSYRPDPRFRYVYEPELGLSRARNAGVRAAKGKYVVFLDDDGEACDGWLQAYADAVKEYPDAIAIGGSIEVAFARPKPWWISGLSMRFYGDYDLGDDVKETDWVPGGNAAWKRDELLIAGGFNPQLGRIGSEPLLGSEESELLDRARASGDRVLYAPRARMRHHIARSRMTPRYLWTRYYGHGATGFRWNMIRNGAATGDLATLLRSARRSRAKEAMLALVSAATLRRDRAVEHLLSCVRHHGFVREAVRHYRRERFAQNSD